VTDRAAPRVEPLPRERWNDDAIAALRNAFPSSVVDRFLSTGPDAVPVPNVLTTMLHHPRLAGPFLTYNQVLLSKPALDPRARELMVLRVAWRTRSIYEWVQHVKLAPRSGITPAEIDAIADGAGADMWTPLERDLLAATDQLIDRYSIDDDTWKRLAESFDEAQLVELVFVVGTYTGLAMAFNSLGIQLDSSLDAASAPPLPDSTRGPVAPN
jgi:alkylhydroperoxidase family enzyme